ncbi:LysR family transcriptional regulator [Enterococcus sp. LJL120]
MNYNHLKYFNALAANGNVTETAKILRISQPSLTYAIKHLEMDLGFSLFEKVGRHIQLTKAGEKFHKVTEQAIAAVDQAAVNLQEAEQLAAQQLNIGIIPTLASSFMPKMLRASQKENFATENYHIFHGFTNEIIAKLETGDYDVGFCSKIADERLEFFEVERQYFALIANQDFPLSQYSIEELFQQPLVTYRQTVPIGQNAHQVLHSYNPHPQIVAEMDDETSIGGYVMENPVIALVADTSLLRQFDLHKFILPDEDRYHSVYLTVLKERLAETKIKQFVDFTKKFITGS